MILILVAAPLLALGLPRPGRSSNAWLSGRRRVNRPILARSRNTSGMSFAYGFRAASALGNVGQEAIQVRGVGRQVFDRELRDGDPDKSDSAQTGMSHGV
jgi:hypothetical protein